MRNLDTDGKPESLAYISSTESLRAKLKRARVKAKTILPIKVPTTWRELLTTGIPDQYKYLKNGSKFLRYFGTVSEGNEELIAVFASDFAIEKLEMAEVISVDGTFSTCPPPFHQLFIIMAKLHGGTNIPCVFGLLPNKTSATYIKFFQVVANLSDKMFAGTVLNSIKNFLKYLQAEIKYFSFL